MFAQPPDASWHIDRAACLAWVGVLEICTNTVSSVAKYSVEK
jgi:hypothetical protein